MEHLADLPSLVAWLESHSYFEDGYLLEIGRSPLSITIGYTISGNYVANTPRKILSFKLTPQNVIEWKGPSACLIPSNDTFFGGIDPLDVVEGIGIQLCFEPPLALIAKSLTIDSPIIIETTFTTWTDPNACYLKAPMEAVPPPKWWLDKCREHGFDIAFRYYRGKRKSTEEVPYPNYTGYFLQLVDLIDRTDKGILFDWVYIEKGIVHISLKNKDMPETGVWSAVKMIIADIPHVVINSGNMSFTSEDFKQLLKST